MNTTEVIAPISKENRINSLDIIRGVSLLGILLMNITGFGLSHAYSDPTISGGATGWNLTAWWTTSMFFEGTMRGMFSMLFGAGIILFTDRKTETINGISVTDAFFRRLMWLFLFGVIHCYLLLWHGEILYPYALIGMFAFSFRHWQPKFLMIGAFVLLLGAFSLSVKDYVVSHQDFDKYTLAEFKKKEHKALTKEDSASIKTWEKKLDRNKPKPEEIKEDVDKQHDYYWNILWYKSSLNQTMQTFVMYRYFFWDIFAMMLLGMAFLKNGIFKAEKSNRFYWIMAAIGYSIGLSVNYWETNYLVSNGFSILSKDTTDLTYDLGRLSTTFAHIAMIMLFVKSGWLLFLQKALGAVGQMAFTNYISQTIICNTIFLGLGYYGQWERHQLYFVVAGIWVLQLVLSPIWLKYFHFGPLEWAWRSLTYWKRPVFKKK